MDEETTYTQEQLDEAARSAVADARAEWLAALSRSYRMGVGGERLCGATNPDVTLRGEPVLCQREPEHPLGQFDRHKAIDNETDPHQAFVWN